MAWAPPPACNRPTALPSRPMAPPSSLPVWFFSSFFLSEKNHRNPEPVLGLGVLLFFPFMFWARLQKGMPCILHHSLTAIGRGVVFFSPRADPGSSLVVAVSFFFAWLPGVQRQGATAFDRYTWPPAPSPPSPAPPAGVGVPLCALVPVMKLTLLPRRCIYRKADRVPTLSDYLHLNPTPTLNPKPSLIKLSPPPLLLNPKP
jgi:hypothetical protein